MSLFLGYIYATCYRCYRCCGYCCNFSQHCLETNNVHRGAVRNSGRECLLATLSSPTLLLFECRPQE